MGKDSQIDSNFSKLVQQELKKDPLREFNIAFVLMSIIPFLVFVYILTIKISSNEVLAGNTGLILFISLVISLCGFCIGYQIVRNTLFKIIEYAAKAKHANQLKSTFVASVSHDFKNPLWVIDMSISNILDGLAGNINEKQKQILRTCKDTVNRMTRLVHDLLDVYKFEVGTVKLSIKSCNFVEILESQLKEFEIICNKKNIQLKKKISSRDLTAMVDEGRIAQVVNNLLNNAIKYTPQGGSVTVKTYFSDGFVRLEVIDTGPGIPPDKKEKIFDKFVRLDTAKEGTGLGLAITKDIVELHHGRIWVESQPNKGSHFVVVLPR